MTCASSNSCATSSLSRMRKKRFPRISFGGASRRGASCQHWQGPTRPETPMNASLSKIAKGSPLKAASKMWTWVKTQIAPPVNIQSPLKQTKMGGKMAPLVGLTHGHVSWNNLTTGPVTHEAPGADQQLSGTSRWSRSRSCPATNRIRLTSGYFKGPVLPPRFQL